MSCLALYTKQMRSAVYTSCLAMMIILLSCDKVINLDIPGTEAQYVIEGVVNESGCRINLSQTLNFSDSNEYRIISGANITISEDGKTPLKLTQINGGYYRSNMTGKPGRTYTLRVEVADKVFTATSLMPEKVRLDTLYVAERLFFGKTRKVATVEFNDPEALGNAYRFIQYVDTKRDNSIYVTNDHLFNGRKTAYEIVVFENEDEPLKPGDQLRIELLTITPFMYSYWYSLSQSALGQSQSASPGNPVNPFQQGAVGYFSTHTSNTHSVTLR